MSSHSDVETCRLLTQELARNILPRDGIDRTRLARLETDVSVPTWPTVLALARTLGVSCEEFLDVATGLREPKRKAGRAGPPHENTTRAKRTK